MPPPPPVSLPVPPASPASPARHPMLDWLAGRSLAVAAALALLSGLVSALGFAPVATPAGPLLGFALLLLLLSVQRRRRAFFLGLCFGFGQFSLGLAWIATAFRFQSAMPPALGVAAVLLLALYLALYPAIAAHIARGICCRIVPLTLLFSGLFTVTELLRGLLFTGFPWNPLGAAFLPLPGVAQLAALVGANGLSALMVLAGGSFAALVGGRGERGRGLLILVFPLLLVLGLAVPRLQRPLPAGDGSQLLLVQTGVGVADKYRPGGEETALQRTLSETARALAAGPPPAAVVWPEATIETPLADEPAMRRRITAALPPQTLLLTGGVGLVRGEGGAVVAATNSLYALDSGGRILARYDKAHLVPFGEYLPWRQLLDPLGLARLVPGAIDFRPGPGPVTWHLPGLAAVAPDICYEVVFPAAIVDRRDRPAFILTVSNDAWFGRSGPPQHFAQARLRAIEEGLPVARVTPTGVSGMIDARGGVVAVLPGKGARAERLALPAARPPTPFSRFGLLLPLALAVLLTGAGLFAARRKS